MILRSLFLSSFRSFRSEATLDFSSMKPGLYHVRGENRAEPDLEGNACGKSTLFEAIYWAAFGRTSRGLRGGDLRSWESSVPCLAALEMEDVPSLLRSWSPNSLEMEGRGAIDQPSLDRVLGIDAEAALFCFYFAQFTKPFADLRPAEQLSLFDSMLDLALWERASSLSQARMVACEAGMHRSRLEIARIEGEAAALLNSDIPEREREWERKAKKEGEARARDLKEAEARGEALKKAAQAAQEGLESILRAGERSEPLLSKLAALRAETRIVKEEAQSLSELRGGGLCPLCHQAISKSHLLSELRRLKDRQSTLVSESLDVEKKMEKAGAEERRAREIARQTERELTEEENKLQICRAEMQAWQRSANPYREQHEQMKLRGEELLVSLEKAHAEERGQEEEAQRFKFWTKAFRELRLLVVRESLDQLTLEANESLFELGLRDWSVAFSIERENKSGGMVKGFSIFVQSPQSKKPVPWEAWSGGESQRIRVAISLGFANLISSRRGFASNIEMWDEPSTWLSRSGILALLQVLAQRAERYGKIILIADHRALDFGGFAGSIDIVKDREGSKIV